MSVKLVINKYSQIADCFKQIFLTECFFLKFFYYLFSCVFLETHERFYFFLKSQNAFFRNDSCATGLKCYLSSRLHNACVRSASARGFKIFAIPHLVLRTTLSHNKIISSSYFSDVGEGRIKVAELKSSPKLRLF